MQLLLLASLLLLTEGTFVFDEEVDPELPADLGLDLDLRSRVRDGQASYDLLKSEVPLYGVCWINALDALHHGCKHLDDEMQSRLGLAFANCFLEKTGGKTVHCPPSQAVAACASEMDDRAFNAYTHFFTHTQSICFFLASQVWQSRAESTIGRLSSTSHQVAQRLEQLQALQRETIETQVQLNHELSGSRAALQDFETTLRAKQSIEQEILMRCLEMRDFVLSEVSKFYAIGFYLSCTIVIFLLTTPTRAREARLWLFLLLIFTFAFERLTVSSVLRDESSILQELRLLSLSLDDHVWMCRKAMLLIALSLLLYFVFTFKDYTAINHMLLNDIRKQNEEIRRLHEISLSQRSNGDLSALMSGCCSSDQEDSSSSSCSEVSDSEVYDLQQEILADDSILVAEPPLDARLKTIVEAESPGVARYNLRSRASSAYAKPTSLMTGSNHEGASVFTSDEDA